MNSSALRADIGRTAATELELWLVRAAAAMTKRASVQRLIYISDLPPFDALASPTVRPKLVHVASDRSRRFQQAEAVEDATLMIPGYEMDAREKVKLALIGAAARGFVRPGDHVIALVGRRATLYPDTLVILEIENSAVEATLLGEIGSGSIAPSVFEVVVDLAVELGVEGWEGHALGAMFVLGDVQKVMRRSRQLGLDPFRGYRDEERNLLDPDVRDAVKGFAPLDGAFVVREDGVVEAAGRYLQLEDRPDLVMSPSFGARHVAAALTTAATRALAIVVSQSSGKVRVFRGGAVVLELNPSVRRT